MSTRLARGAPPDFGSQAAESQGGVVRGLGELEAVIMDRLWTRAGTATVRELLDELH